MTHEEIKTYISEKLKDPISNLLEDETQANYVSILAKLYSELYDYEEEKLMWLTSEELDEMILTIYYGCSRARHAVTQNVNKEVKKYVKQAYHDWEINKEIYVH